MKPSPVLPHPAPSSRVLPAEPAGSPETVYRSLFESSPVAMLLEDADGVLLDLNAAAARLFGYARGKLLGQNVRCLAPAGEVSRMSRDRAELRAGQVLVQEAWGLRQDGTLCPLELHEQCLTLPDGQLGILAVAQDLTARKQTEATLHLRDTALQAAANGIVVTDREGRIVWANAAFSRATGYTLKEALGQNPRIFQSGQHDQVFYQQLWDTILAGRVWQGELINRRRDGSQFHEHATITPVRDGTGQITHFIAVKQDITERNRLAEELQQSERFVRATLDALSAQIAMLDERGVILDVNAAWREFARERRFAPGEFSEGAQYLTACRRISDARNGLLQKIAAGLRAVLQGQVPVFTFELPCPEAGEPRWFVGRVTRFTGGGPARLVVAHEDVTQRKHAEHALTLSGHQYRVLTETMKDVVWILDAEQLRFRYVSPSVKLLRGYTAEEVMAEPATRALVPASADRFIRFIRERAEAVRTGQASPDHFDVSELEQPCQDGRTVWTEVVTSYHVNPGTGHVEVWGVSRDITEREQARRALQQAKERFQALFLASPLPIVVLDRDATVRMWSPAAEDVFGWTAAEVLGQVSPFVPEDQRQEMLGFLALVLAGETIRRSEPRQRQRKDGALVDVLISAAPLHELDGSVSGIIFVFTDLTEKTRLEAQLLRAQRLESIGHLAGGIAHDLNNALAPVLMAAPALRPELTSPASQSILNLIEASAHRGAEIVKQILVFARGGQVEKVPVQTRHLLRETGDAIRETFPGNILLKTSLPRDLWLVEGNSTQLHQVVMNLCLNARDAMPDGGTLTLAAENLHVAPVVASRITHGQPGPHVVWTIGDTGHGIAPENLGRIFDPFFTTKEVGQGTGLGLATVFGIVRFHGGFLQVESALGQGTQFKIFLPASRTSTPAPAPESPAMVPGRGELVLVVEDDLSVQQILGTLLKQHGYRVELANDGHAALALAQQLGPRLSVVLTDLVMPRMNGCQLIRALHLAGLRPTIVVMSGLANDTVLAELEQLGVQHLLQKPCRLPAVLATLRHALDAADAPG